LTPNEASSFLRPACLSSVKIWRLSKNYEEHLRKALTEPVYQQLAQKHGGGLSKAVKARLIATEPGQPIPPPVDEILKWLAP
jgi:hypothetical protein